MPYRMWGGRSQNAFRARERVGRAAGVLKPCRSQARSCVLCALHVFEWVTRGTGPHNPPQRSTPYMCAIPYVGWTFTERLARVGREGSRPSWLGGDPQASGQPFTLICRLRPHDAEYTTSHPNREVKRCTASVVLWWGTTREVLVL